MIGADDQVRLRNCLERLTTTGELEYTGEYGAEITTFIPFVGWLKREGHMEGRRIRTYSGMRPYYFFLDDDEFAGKPDHRNWVPVRQRYWPSPSTYTATASPWHHYPDYRTHYLSSGMKFERPIIFVQNKFTIDWGVGPINFIPVVALERFLHEAGRRFDIVYSRPGSFAATEGYSADWNIALNYPDADILSRSPGVHHLERMCAEGGLDYNRTKLEILAKSKLFIAVQGGGSHVLACFGDSLLLLFDREGSEHFAPDGHEYPHAYRRGPYKYLAKVPPTLIVPRSFNDFHAAMLIIARAAMPDGATLLPANAMSQLEGWVM